MTCPLEVIKIRVQSSEYDEERRSRIVERFRSATPSSTSFDRSSRGTQYCSEFRPVSSCKDSGGLCRPVRWQPSLHAAGSGHYNMHPSLTSSISTSSHSLHFPMVMSRSGVSLLANSNASLIVNCFRLVF